jgi:hypothetical protein
MMTFDHHLSGAIQVDLKFQRIHIMFGVVSEVSLPYGNKSEFKLSVKTLVGRVGILTGLFGKQASIF